MAINPEEAQRVLRSDLYFVMMRRAPRYIKYLPVPKIREALNPGISAVWFETARDVQLEEAVNVLALKGDIYTESMAQEKAAHFLETAVSLDKVLSGVVVFSNYGPPPGFLLLQEFEVILTQ